MSEAIKIQSEGRRNFELVGDDASKPIGFVVDIYRTYNKILTIVNDKYPGDIPSQNEELARMMADDFHIPDPDHSTVTKFVNHVCTEFDNLKKKVDALLPSPSGSPESASPS